MAAHMNGRGLALRVGGAGMEIRTIPGSTTIIVVLSFNFYPRKVVVLSYNYYPREEGMGICWAGPSA